MSIKKDMSPYKEYIIQRFCYENATDEAIASEITNMGFYVAESRICTYRKEENIKRLHKDLKWLTRQFVESGNNASDVAKKINCNPSTIRKAWVKMGLDTFKTQNVYEVNNIFSKYSCESSYWAGFINADGHIETYQGYGRNLPNYKLKIMLGIQDELHLEKISKSLIGEVKLKDKQYTTALHPESDINEKTYFQKEFRIANKKICLDLIEKFDIIPTYKTTIECPPYKMPRQFYHDYIRGYFDGDGCIHVIKGNGRRGVITIVGSKHICDFIKNTISSYYCEDIGRVRIDYHQNSNLYYFIITDKFHIQLFYLYIYKNNGPFLERKKDKFEKIFKSNGIRYSLNF